MSSQCAYSKAVTVVLYCTQNNNFFKIIVIDIKINSDFEIESVIFLWIMFFLFIKFHKMFLSEWYLFCKLLSS